MAYDESRIHSTRHYGGLGQCTEPSTQHKQVVGGKGLLATRVGGSEKRGGHGVP